MKGATLTADSLLMVRAADAAEIAGISPQRLHYWERTDLVSPTVTRQISKGKRVRLYDVRDLTTLMVVAKLVRNPSISLQHVRKVVEHLRGTGYDAPLTELRFRIDHDEIVFQHPDGMWEGSAIADQMVEVTLRIDLAEMHHAAEQAIDRPRRIGASRIERRRGVLASKPVLADTRVPVSAVEIYLARGFDDDEILSAFPELEPADINVVRKQRAAS